MPPAATIQTLPAVGQLDMFEDTVPRDPFFVATVPEIDVALRANAPIAAAISGGKDSQALAYRVFEHLDRIGHGGPRLLIHSDLGRVEWRDSITVCERVARRLDTELLVVRRRAGDMMDRWLSRWAGNVSRYSQLSCVKLILPWSTPSSRFCTSELKAQPMASALRKRFPTGPLVTAIGIRRDESHSRARMPVWRVDERTSRRRGAGYAWHPLHHWSRDEVLQYIRRRGDVLHPAYTIFSSSRVSCAFCILASAADLHASARCEANHAIFREMVELEIASTFSFQSGHWLGDVAPHLLDAQQLNRLADAKARAALREGAERRIPERLLHVKGWPTGIPDATDASLLAQVRRDVAATVGLVVRFTDADSVRDRYAELLRERDRRAGAELLDATA